MSATLILETLGWVPVAWLVAVLLLVDRGRLPRDGLALRIAGCAAAAVVVAAAAVANMWPVAALGLLWLRTEVFAHRHPIHEFHAHREHARQDRARREQAAAGRSSAEAEVTELALIEQGLSEPGPTDLPADQQPNDGRGDEAQHRPKRLQPDLAHQTLAQLELPTPGQTRQRQISHGHANPGQSDRRPPPSGLPRPRASYGGGSRPGRPGTPDSTHHHRPAKSLGARIIDAIFKIEVMIVVIVALVIFGIWAQHQRIVFTQNADSSLCKLMGGC